MTTTIRGAFAIFNSNRVRGAQVYGLAGFILSPCVQKAVFLVVVTLLLGGLLPFLMPRWTRHLPGPLVVCEWHLRTHFHTDTRRRTQPITSAPRRNYGDSVH